MTRPMATLAALVTAAVASAGTGRRRPDTTTIAGISDPKSIRAGVPRRPGLPAAVLAANDGLRIPVRPRHRDVEPERPRRRLSN